MQISSYPIIIFDPTKYVPFWLQTNRHLQIRAVKNEYMLVLSLKEYNNIMHHCPITLLNLKCLKYNMHI